jgi:hypothetical protein
MAFRDNWLRHLSAPFTGEFFSDALAKDFWFQSEDLWRAVPNVEWRWAKLFLVYLLSGLTQIVAPLLAVATVYVFVFDRSFQSALIGLAIGVSASLLGGVIGATWSCLSVSRNQIKSELPK